MYMNHLGALKEKLSHPQRVLIFPHQKPDADALGSCLALWGYLRKQGHDVTVISPTDYPRFLNWMPGQDLVQVYRKDERERFEALVAAADLLCCLDFSALGRIDDLGKMVALQQGKGKILLIDHHRIGKEDFADYELWNPEASSTAELIYEYIEMDGGKELIDQEIAACIYAGIMTDTGSFKYPSTSSRTLRIAADLKDLGLETSHIHNLVYDNNTEARLRFMGYALSEKMVFWREYETAFITISREDRKRFHSQVGDTEGFVNYCLSVEGIAIAALFKEDEENEDLIKISFRSIGDFNVAELAARYFNGGGHRNAAGGRLLGQTLEQAIALFNRALSEMYPAHQQGQTAGA